jgi:long-chain acyl-CoA synthetase
MSESSSLGVTNPILGKKKPAASVCPPRTSTSASSTWRDGKTEVPRGQPGELLLKGRRLLGYWENPEETKNQLVDGWLHTGDVVVQDEDGFFVHRGPEKRHDHRRRVQHLSREVDEVLYRHPRSRRPSPSAFPTPTGGSGEGLRGSRGGSGGHAEEIIAFCKEKMAPYKVPREIEFRKSLPQSAAGKILRRSSGRGNEKETEAMTSGPRTP